MTRPKFFGIVDAAGDPVAVEPEPCGCDESKSLRAELESVIEACNYLLQFCDASELLQMRKHLAAEWAARQGHLATEQQSDVEEIIGNG